MKLNPFIIVTLSLLFACSENNTDTTEMNTNNAEINTTSVAEKTSFFMPNHQTSPIVKNGMVYFGSWKTTFCSFGEGTGHLFAVDVQTKKEIWRFKPKYDVGSTPVFLNGTLYFGNGELINFGSKPVGEKGVFYALNSKTGEEKWKFETNGGINLKPAIDGNIIYFGCHNGYLYALDLDTGEEKWKYKTGGPIVSSPIIADGVIYLGSDDGYLHAIDIKTREMKWKFHTDSNNKLDFLGGVLTPGISESIVYAIRHAGNYLYAIDKKTGKEMWKYPAEGETIPTTTSGGFQHSPAVSYNNMVYIKVHDNALIALDEKTGKQLWKIIPDGGSMHNSYPYIDNNTIYIVNLESIYLYSFNAKTGKKNWQFKNEGRIFSTPVVSNNLIFMNSLSGHLYAVNIQTGKLDFEFVPEH